MNRGLRNEWALMLGLAAGGLMLLRRNTDATVLGAGALGLALLPARPYSFAGRGVVITGGSRGLGLALARQFFREGAQVALLARDEAELNRAVSLLQKYRSPKYPEANILPIPCDVTRPDALQQAIERAAAHFGTMDVLVNDAGTITVGPFETMEREDFEAQMRLHLQAAIESVHCVLPIFRQQGEGRIINISSIGGDLPVPHMTPYCASKFALAGFSETLAAELAPDNIKVTTVYPGMMRTGSPIQAVFKGDHQKEYVWFATGDVMPGFSVSADYAARRIVEASRRGDAQVRYPLITHVGMIGHAVFPETYAWIMRQAARRMPRGTSHVRQTGAQSKALLESQRWYQPLKKREEQAEADLNQVEKDNAEFNMGI